MNLFLLCSGNPGWLTNISGNFRFVLFVFAEFLCISYIMISGVSKWLSVWSFFSFPYNWTQFFTALKSLTLCSNFHYNLLDSFPVDTRRRFNVYKTLSTSYRRLIDFETTLCVYWFQLGHYSVRYFKSLLQLDFQDP